MSLKLTKLKIEQHLPGANELDDPVPNEACFLVDIAGAVILVPCRVIKFLQIIY